MSRPALAAAALALAMSSAGCVHSVVSPAARLHPRLAGIAEVGLRLEVIDGFPFDRMAPDELARTTTALRERLQARGVPTVISMEEPAPGRVLVTVWILAERRDALTRWAGIPWVIVHAASVGLVPYREARETLVDVEVVDPRAPRGRQVHVERRAFTTSAWSWLPLLPGSDLSARRPLDVAREGLLRAVDDALDAALAP